MGTLIKNLKKIGGLALVLGLLSPATWAATLINGAGATFPYPLYSKWFSQYQSVNSQVQFNYQSIGSGGGVQQITAKTVDFGASDAPMSDDDLEKVFGTVLHIPTVLGAVVVSYNAPVGNDLKLTGPVVADIFLGKITKWNDPRIAQLNPGVSLPGSDIMVVHRSDGSGTSYVFTDYLSKASSAWKSTVGTGKAVRWPVGIGSKGNEGVTASIKETPGSIGYVELNYAIANNLPYATLQNKAGNLIKPSMASVSAAAEGALDKMPSDYRVSITESPAPGAYPISSFTYLLVYKKQSDVVKGKALVDFLNWAMHDGQKTAPALYYAPLPASLVQKVEGTISQIKVGS